MIVYSTVYCDKDRYENVAPVSAFRWHSHCRVPWALLNANPYASLPDIISFHDMFYLSCRKVFYTIRIHLPASEVTLVQPAVVPLHSRHQQQTESSLPSDLSRLVRHCYVSLSFEPARLDYKSQTLLFPPGHKHELVQFIRVTHAQKTLP